jgi:hypothetical protein
MALLMAETSDHQVPRERVCGVLPGHQEGLERLWDHVVQATGIDPDTAVLTRLSLDTGTDGLVEVMDLGFHAKKSGSRQQYLISYRRDIPGCGWVDGLSYPADLPGIGPAPHQNPRDVLAGIGRIPPAAIGLSGDHLRVTGSPSRWLSGTGDPQPAGGGYLWTNRSLLPLQASREIGAPAGHAVSLTFSDIECTMLREGMVRCSSVRSARVFL